MNLASVCRGKSLSKGFTVVVAANNQASDGKNAIEPSEKVDGNHLKA